MEMNGEKKSREGRRHRERHLKNWVTCGLVLSLLCASVFLSLYGYLHERLRERIAQTGREEQYGIQWLWQSNYLLYRDLYNKVNGSHLSCSELYLGGLLKDIEDLQSEVNQMTEQDGEMLDFEYPAYESKRQELEILSRTEESFQFFFQRINESYEFLNRIFDYRIEDLETGAVVSNVPGEELSLEDSVFYISFVFDGDGGVELGESVAGRNVDETELRKYASNAYRNQNLYELFWFFSERVGADAAPAQALTVPVNCRVTYRIGEDAWDTISGGLQNLYIYWDDSYHSVRLMENYDRYSASYEMGWSGGFSAVEILLLIVFAAGIFLPAIDRERPWIKGRIFKTPLEILVVLGFNMLNLMTNLMDMALYTMEGSMASVISRSLSLSETAGWNLSYLINLAVLTCYFFFCWYLGVCMRGVRELKIGGYLRERSLVGRNAAWAYGKVKGFYRELARVDLTKKSRRIIVKVVLVNAVILFGICSLWFGGWAVTVIYSLGLFWFLNRYVSDLQKKYGVLLQAINQIAAGYLNVSITEELGVFEPFKPQIYRIQEGFKKAVEEETKSQRMKAELITNVSHDLKTPLTAIITYIDLLKGENLTEEQRSGYLDTLERKALRLKALIEDLFEVSKANSQNITLHLMDVDLGNLVKQAAFEMEDKLREAQLDLRMNLPEEKIILRLDSQKTYRIFENLFGNVAKYALHGTRVYAECKYVEDRAVVTLKNIAAEEITTAGEELTERFVRGDASRNTEGNGLGLAIARSFAELQGGLLKVDVDGDLFKVTVSFFRVEEPDSQVRRKD